MESYWIKSTKKKEFESLNDDIISDILIIGGGLTGITTAYYLTEEGKDVTVIERSRIGEHTSGNNTGKITSQHGLFYNYLINSQSEEFAKKYYEANQKAIKEIKNIIHKEGIDCGFKTENSYVFTNKIEEIENLKKEVEAVKKIGGKVRMVEKTEVPIQMIAAIEFPEQASFNPKQYINGLAEKVVENGGNIFEKTVAIKVEKDSKGYITYLNNDKKIKSNIVVLATHYPIINIPGYYFMKMYQSMSYIIAIDPKEKLFDGMYINAELPTISLRPAKYKDEELLLIAGSDHKTGDKRDLSNRYSFLEKIAKEMYPNCEVKYKWNAEDCISLDKIPYIGTFSSLMPDVYLGTGYNKWGITLSNVAANIITDKILGRENEYADIFNSTRVEPVKNIEEVKNMLKETTYSLVLNKFNIPEETLKDVKKGEGKIVEVENKKIGIYKDENGKIFAIKPICSHLGCEVSWNNLDKTWDCPCHGSRFNYKGECISEPAIKDLEVIDINE